jgi:hypothetical protein
MTGGQPENIGGALLTVLQDPNPQSSRGIMQDNLVTTEAAGCRRQTGERIDMNPAGTTIGGSAGIPVAGNEDALTSDSDRRLPDC